MELFSIMTGLDEKDRKIISMLKENSRMTTGEMSKKSGIPQTTIHNRIRKLKKEGVIKRFTIDLDRKMLGKGLVAFIHCSVSYRTDKGKKTDQYEVATRVNAMPEVEGVSIVTGENDLIVRVALKDVDELNDFIISKLRNIDGIERTMTSVVLSEVQKDIHEI